MEIEANVLPKTKDSGESKEVKLLTTIPLRNLNYFHRPRLYERLRSTLQDTHVAILAGLDKSGKTELVKAYVYEQLDNPSKYFLIAWIDCKKTNEKEIKEIKKRVSSYKDPNRKWLVIFDDISDTQLFKNFCEDLYNGDIVCTSQHADWPTIIKVGELEKYPIEIHPKETALLELLATAFELSEENIGQKIQLIVDALSNNSEIWLLLVKKYKIPTKEVFLDVLKNWQEIFSRCLFDKSYKNSSLLKAIDEVGSFYAQVQLKVVYYQANNQYDEAEEFFYRILGIYQKKTKVGELSKERISVFIKKINRSPFFLAKLAEKIKRDDISTLAPNDLEKMSRSLYKSSEITVIAEDHLQRLDKTMFHKDSASSAESKPNPAVISLMYFISFLKPDNIPRSLLNAWLKKLKRDNNSFEIDKVFSILIRNFTLERHHNKVMSKSDQLVLYRINPIIHASLHKILEKDLYRQSEKLEPFANLVAQWLEVVKFFDKYWQNLEKKRKKKKKNSKSYEREWFILLTHVEAVLSYFPIFNKNRNENVQQTVSRKPSALPRKGLSDKGELSHQQLIKMLPRDKTWDFGMAIDNGDCFYDALAQSLHARAMKSTHTLKSLREICSDYIYQLNEQSPEANWVKEAIEKDIEKSNEMDDYQTHLTSVQYTQEEMTKLKEESKAFTGYAIWGKPDIEGKILAQQLNISLHIIEFHEAGSGMEAVEPTHILVTKDKVTQVEKESIHYQNEQMIHLAVYRNHFVPILPSRYLEQQQSTQEDHNQEMTHFNKHSHRSCFALSNFSKDEISRLKKHIKAVTDSSLDGHLVQKIQAISLENRNWTKVKFGPDELKLLKKSLDGKGKGSISAKLLENPLEKNLIRIAKLYNRIAVFYYNQDLYDSNALKNFKKSLEILKPYTEEKDYIEKYPKILEPLTKCCHYLGSIGVKLWDHPEIDLTKFSIEKEDFIEHLKMSLNIQNEEKDLQRYGLSVWKTKRNLARAYVKNNDFGEANKEYEELIKILEEARDTNERNHMLVKCLIELGYSMVNDLKNPDKEPKINFVEIQKKFKQAADFLRPQSKISILETEADPSRSSFSLKLSERPIDNETMDYYVLHLKSLIASFEVKLIEVFYSFDEMNDNYIFLDETFRRIVRYSDEYFLTFIKNLNNVELKVGRVYYQFALCIYDHLLAGNLQSSQQNNLILRGTALTALQRSIALYTQLYINPQHPYLQDTNKLLQKLYGKLSSANDIQKLSLSNARADHDLEMELKEINKILSQIISDKVKIKEQLIKRGGLLVALSRFDDALIDFNKALEIDDMDATIYEKIGYARYQLDEFEESTKAFKKALKLHPGNPNYQLWLTTSENSQQLADLRKTNPNPTPHLTPEAIFIENLKQEFSRQILYQIKKATGQHTLWSSSEKRWRLFGVVANLLPNFRFSYSGAEADIGVRDFAIKLEELQLEKKSTKSLYYAENINDLNSKLADSIDSLATEIAVSYQEQITSLDNEDAARLGSYTALKMLSYVAFGSANPRDDVKKQLSDGVFFGEVPQLLADFHFSSGKPSFKLKLKDKKTKERWSAHGLLTKCGIWSTNGHIYLRPNKRFSKQDKSDKYRFRITSSEDAIRFGYKEMQFYEEKKNLLMYSLRY